LGEIESSVGKLPRGKRGRRVHAEEESGINIYVLISFPLENMRYRITRSPGEGITGLYDPFVFRALRKFL